MVFIYLVSLLLIASYYVSAQSCTSITTLSCSAAPSAIPIPNPWYSLNFSAPGNNTSWQWTNVDPADTNCSYAPSGSANFTGGISGTNNSYIDLNAASGPNSAALPLPATIGSGTVGGSILGGTAGWTFEFTFKPTLAGNGNYNWAKVFCIGSAPNQNNLFMGWNGGSAEWDFGMYDQNGRYAQWTIVSSSPGLTINKWVRYGYI